MGFFAKYADKKRVEGILSHISKNMKILDLGCGKGWLTTYLNNQGYNCVGVDTEVENKHPFYRGSAEKIPFAEGYFDCIIMIEVIEHINPICYNEINRVLKSHGKIILSTPVPEFDSFCNLLSKLRIIDERVTPHINLVHLEELPWKLLTKFKILVVDQFGVFEKL